MDVRKAQAERRELDKIVGGLCPRPIAIAVRHALGTPTGAIIRVRGWQTMNPHNVAPDKAETMALLGLAP